MINLFTMGTCMICICHRLQGHATQRTFARLILHYLRMHGAGVFLRLHAKILTITNYFRFLELIKKPANATASTTINIHQPKCIPQKKLSPLLCIITIVLYINDAKCGLLLLLYPSLSFCPYPSLSFFASYPSFVYFPSLIYTFQTS